MKPEEVSKLALGLPVQARAKLALDLLASLENVSGFDIGKLLAMDPVEIKGSSPRAGSLCSIESSARPRLFRDFQISTIYRPPSSHERGTAGRRRLLQTPLFTRWDLGAAEQHRRALTTAMH